MGKLFEDNGDAIAAGKFDEVAIFPKWSNAKKVDEITRKILRQILFRKCGSI